MHSQPANENNSPNSIEPVARPDDTACPFLVPVVADRLWVYPVSAYCRRPDHPVRVPASSTLAHVCADDYSCCPGYQASRAESDAER